MSLAAASLVESNLLALWSQAFLRPEMDFVRTLQNGSYCARMFKLLPAEEPTVAPIAVSLQQLSDELAGLTPERARLQMELAYNKLFVGPGRLLAPPYESFWRTNSKDGTRGTLRGLPELKIQEAYAQSGYEVPADFCEFPDHIAVQLEFLSQLAAREYLAALSGDQESTVALIQMSESFIKTHFSYWIDDFSISVRAGDTSGFYAALAQLVRNYFLY